MTTIPLTRRPDLHVGDTTGTQCYAQDSRTGARYQMGAREAFLLSQLDGLKNYRDIALAYAECFREELTSEDLDQFLEVALEQGLVQAEPATVSQEVAQDVEEYQDRFASSERLFARAQRVIAGSTTHDRRDFGPFPVYIDRAEGPWKWEVTGRRLLDYWMGHGALLCGHNYPPVVEAVCRQMTRGTHFGACHEQEVQWAELVQRLMPSAEKVRFTASGTEATQLAMRVARAHTGRPLIVRFDGHFHGWHDEAMAHFYPPDAAGFNPGTLENVAIAEVNSLESALAFLETGQVAGVILEPGGGSAGGMPWTVDFLKALRQATTAHGSLLIFDEVISGFRQGPGGVQGLTGIIPDLTTLAKILCGGLPGGALVGQAGVMAVFGPGTQINGRSAQVPHTGTFNGNPLSAAAGIALLRAVADGVAQERACQAAESLVRAVNQAAAEAKVDVFLYANGTSIFHILIGAHKAQQPLGPSVAVKSLQAAHPRRYAQLRRALLLEGLDTHPVHGWVSAMHDGEVVEASVGAFARAFHRLRNTEGFAL